MIIKVPVYVEITEPVIQDRLPKLVEHFNALFSSVIKREISEQLSEATIKEYFLLKKLTEKPTLKILNKERVLDTLRK